MKRSIRFYFAFYLAKISVIALKLIKRDATQFPGKLAITLCPNFLEQIGKPKTIIAVTTVYAAITTATINAPAMSHFMLYILLHTKCALLYISPQNKGKFFHIVNFQTTKKDI